jgi:uncharacterized protein YlxP (DUF503 family)
MSVGLLSLHLQLPGCASLKEKRSRIKPLISRLHREFNVSVAEIGYQDGWHDTLIACALVSNDHNHTQQALQVIPGWIEKNWHDLTLVDDHIELL